MKFELKTLCCDKEMVKIDWQPAINTMGGESMMLVCSECGSYHQINRNMDLDEDELEDYKQNYPKEFGLED